jgi:hypothetical protein
MANRLVSREVLDISGAVTAVNKATTPKILPAQDKTKKMKTIPVRTYEDDYDDLKKLFGGQGLALARAGNLALFYVAEQLKMGRISVTKAGIIDRRG